MFTAACGTETGPSPVAGSLPELLRAMVSVGCGCFGGFSEVHLICCSRWLTSRPRVKEDIKALKAAWRIGAQPMHEIGLICRLSC